MGARHFAKYAATYFSGRQSAVHSKVRFSHVEASARWMI